MIITDKITAIKELRSYIERNYNVLPGLRESKEFIDMVVVKQQERLTQFSIQFNANCYSDSELLLLINFLNAKLGKMEQNETHKETEEN